MQFPYEFQLGWRYTRAGRASGRNGFISFISGVSMLGIALGVAALIIVLSVMNGFQKDVRDRMLSVLAHIEITRVDGAPLADWSDVAHIVARNPLVIGTAPYVGAQVLLSNGETMNGALVRGIDPAQEPRVTEIAGILKREGVLGELRPGRFGIVLGAVLARTLGVAAGDRVTLVAPTGEITPAGVVPRLKQMRVVGTFSAGNYEYDSTLALVNIEDAARLFRTGGPTGLRVQLADMQQAPRVAHALAGQLAAAGAPDLMVSDWTRANRTWFAAVQVEKRMMFIILTLIVAVAAFNLVSTLVMTVTDKRADIAILRTLGATPASIMKIFVVQGAAVGVLGTLAGVLLGCLIAFNIDVIVPFLEHLLHTQFLPSDIYLISRMPSDPRASDIVPIALISLALAFVATLYPSWRASRMNPAEALRYE